MCTNKCNIIAFITALVVGILGAYLACIGFCQLLTVAVWIVLVIALFAILILQITATSSMRKCAKVNHCICKQGKEVLYSAILVVAVAIAFIVLQPVSLIMPLVAIFAFLIGAAFGFMIVSLVCFMQCLLSIGCRRPGDEN